MNTYCWSRVLLFGLCFSAAFSAQAQMPPDKVFYYESFPDEECVIRAGYNVTSEWSPCNERFQHRDLTSYSEDEWNTALGHHLSVVSSSRYTDSDQDERQIEFFEVDTVKTDNPKRVYLYLRLVQECAEDEEWDRSDHMCKPRPGACTDGEQRLLSGYSSPLIGAEGRVWVVELAPATACVDSCLYVKPSRSHSCFSDSPLTEADFAQGVVGGKTGFCNYLYESSIESCSWTPDTGLPEGRYGYALDKPSDWGGAVCPDGTPIDPNVGGECPSPGGSGPGGGSGGGSGGDGGSGDGSGGDGGSGDGSGGDGGSGGGGSGGDGDGGDDSGSSVGGEACDATVQCSGDAIQCAILRQQKKQACLLADANDWERGKGLVESELGGDEYQMPEQVVDVSGLFDTGVRFLPSACPPPKQLYIATFGRSIELSWEPLCQFAEIISYFVVAMASLFFVVYVGRAFGGD